MVARIVFFSLSQFPNRFDLEICDVFPACDRDIFLKIFSRVINLLLTKLASGGNKDIIA